MIVGNQQGTDVLKRYIDNFLESENKSVPFFIISGPQNIGKSTIILELVKQYLGQFFVQDFLYIRDLSDKLGKHSIKVATPKDNDKRFVQIDDNNVYEDIGVREINSWFQQSSIGKTKMIFIENIERMTNEAANAFLKTCEEPLPGRIIIASTSNQSQLLDTIRSRSISLRFQELSYEEVLEFVQQNGYFSDDEKLKKFVCNMAMGRPGVVVKLHEIFEKNNDLKSDFKNLVDILSNDGPIFHSHKILNSISADGYLDQFLDGWISYCVENNMIEQSDSWMKVKKMMKSNVNIENLLLYGLLNK
ncbi:AAA family ATPase [Candidatus Gracilibacteria bacterium]|nr:AAA family ATPase [Candidatus Gracilibacteria bacterium]